MMKIVKKIISAIIRPFCETKTKYSESQIKQYSGMKNAEYRWNTSNDKDYACHDAWNRTYLQPWK